MNKMLITAALAAGFAGAANGGILVDYGGSATTTASPDANSNHWNNFVPGNFVSLVDTDNTATGIGLFATSGVGSGANGGLLTPDAGLLGDLAVQNATRDYVFTAGAALSFTLNGLDAGTVYAIDFFATRATDATRITRYTAMGGHGTATTTLQTSGVGIGNDGVYNGNDDELASLTGLTADANGEIQFTVSVETGGFAYLGAMELSVVPAPGASAMLAVGGMMICRRRRA